MKMKTGNKFQENTFYKNRGDCCDFVEVHEVVSDNGISAELKVTWYTQMHDGWRKVCTDQFLVSKNQYHKWTNYHPRGERRQL